MIVKTTLEMSVHAAVNVAVSAGVRLPPGAPGEADRDGSGGKLGATMVGCGQVNDSQL